MSTKFTTVMRYPHGPAQVFEMFRDPAYIEEKATRGGARDVAANVTDEPDGTVVTLNDRHMPAELPAFARKIVGEVVHVVEKQRWSPAAADGTVTGTFTVDMKPAPISMTGSLRLVAEDSGSKYTIEAEIKAGVPLIGGKLEGVAKDQMERYLATEQEVGLQRLAR